MCAKIRECFISNSSSSSYVIHKSEFPSEEAFAKVIENLDNLREELREEFYSWGESERTFDEDGNYLFVETYYVYGLVEKAFEAAGVDFKKLDKLYLD